MREEFPKEAVPNEVAHEQMAVLLRCFYCGKHTLQDSVHGHVNDVPMPVCCWITCSRCGRGPMTLDAMPIVYPVSETPPTVWDFVRLNARPMPALTGHFEGFTE